MHATCPFKPKDRCEPKLWVLGVAAYAFACFHRDGTLGGPYYPKSSNSHMAQTWSLEGLPHRNSWGLYTYTYIYIICIHTCVYIFKYVYICTYLYVLHGYLEPLGLELPVPPAVTLDFGSCRIPRAPPTRPEP